ANGKIDRRALAAMRVKDGDRAGETEGASTPIEELVEGIWSEVLGRQQIGRRENFFDLGGHSLLATRVTSRLRETFKVELSLRKMFEKPTIAELAKEITAAISVGEALGDRAIKPVSRAGELPLSYAQQRLWFIDQLE